MMDPLLEQAFKRLGGIIKSKREAFCTGGILENAQFKEAVKNIMDIIESKKASIRADDPALKRPIREVFKDPQSLPDVYHAQIALSAVMLALLMSEILNFYCRGDVAISLPLNQNTPIQHVEMTLNISLRFMDADHNHAERVLTALAIYMLRGEPIPEDVRKRIGGAMYEAIKRPEAYSPENPDVGLALLRALGLRGGHRRRKPVDPLALYCRVRWGVWHGKSWIESIKDVAKLCDISVSSAKRYYKLGEEEAQMMRRERGGVTHPEPGKHR